MSWGRIDLRAVADRPSEPPTSAGLVYPGHRHLVSGEPETAKSNAAAVAGLEAIRPGDRFEARCAEESARETT